MPLTLEWPDVALRLALTVLAGVVVGINRSERGRPAGLRTCLLVCLAASLSMILANRLLPTSGKASDSFTSMDVMRLPLGILTGMGFIGAGAILRHGEQIHGVTTAATLWFVTVIGLCFGAGQHVLGLAGLGLGLVVLWLLKRMEAAIPQDRHARLTVLATAYGPTDAEVRSLLQAAGFETASWAVAYAGRGEERRRTLHCEVRWHERGPERPPPPLLGELAAQPGVLKLRWKV